MARTQGSFSDVTGPRIHAAAQALFARHGYAAVSMRQIAGEVGVQAGALYNYTPDKQSLLVALMRAHMDELLSTYAAEDVPDDPCAALRHFVRFHIRFHLPRHDAVFIAYMELRNLSPENFTVIEALRRDYETHLETILRSGNGTSVFDVRDTKLTTLAIIAMLTEITTWYREGGRLAQAEVEEIYLALVCRMVRGAEGG
ncbi:TetR/AcrR family transcriptional regulator [Pseudaestuariivita atlantica]|uniref:TetR family transcriptional regulator n=1 Tax=Pseudaestuariivita atlantica TaxID=1317121 RepID=A0A0L1JLM9_9RHOB|nr:TetR/AcrR family transcriptional regulator [Pseudaestuariivita atlantica]KNG92659.1 TetR family transcriptional regulator [Pseudaestuariivita atlantica]